MKWEVGDRLRITNRRQISACYRLTERGIYEVAWISDIQDIIGIYDDDTMFYLFPDDFPYIERVIGDEDTERNAELGEPSANCNCVTLAEIAEELIDIKAMIGRLLRNGGETE